MSKYQVALFDLDGTLTDPGEGITNSVMYALKKMGIEENDRKKLYKFIGPPLSKTFSEFYGFSEEESLKCVEYYREYFSDIGIFENKPYDGIHEFLGDLKRDGVCLAVATSKPEVFARRILEKFNLSEYFEFCGGALLDGTRVDKGDVIAYTLKNCSLSGKTIMVGDRKHDIIGAKCNGIDSVGVLYGYGSRVEFEESGADFIVQNLAELKAVILEK